MNCFPIHISLIGVSVTFPNCKTYLLSVSVETDKTAATVTAAVPDAKSECLVNGEKLKSQVALNSSFTKINVDVTSPDGTGKAVSDNKKNEDCTMPCIK